MRQVAINRIIVKNYKCIEDFDLSLDNNLYLISGRNGSGKTSLFEAIYVCLYNRRPNGKSASSTIMKGKDFSELEVHMEIDSVSHIIKRRIGSKSSFTIETENGDKFKSTDAKRYIEEIIPNYVVKLSLLQDVDLKEIFTKLVDVEPLLNTASEKVKAIKQQILTLETEVQHNSSELEKVNYQISNLTSRIDSINYEITTIYQTQELNVDEERLFEIAEKQKRFNQEYNRILQEKQNVTNVKRDDLNTKIQKIYSELGIVNNKLQELQSIPVGGTCPVCKQPINEEHAKQFIEESKKLSKIRQELESKLNELNSEYQQLNSQNLTFEAKEETMSISEISEEELNFNVSEYQRKLAAQREIDNKINELNVRKEEIENQISSFEIMREELSKKMLETKKKISKQENALNLVSVLADRRIIKKAVSNLTADVLNNILVEIPTFSVKVELNESDNVVVTATNNNGETVFFEDLSQGEQALAKLTLYLAVRKILSENINFKILFFDEFIDHLDPEASQKLLPVLKQLSEDFKIMLITFNSYISENDIWDQTINMESYLQ